MNPITLHENASALTSACYLQDLSGAPAGRPAVSVHAALVALRGSEFEPASVTHICVESSAHVTVSHEFCRIDGTLCVYRDIVER